MMKIHRRLTDVRTASRRVSRARNRCADDADRLHRHFHAHPLGWVGAAGGTGLLVGLAGGQQHGRLVGLWRDPTLRWLLRLLVQAP